MSGTRIDPAKIAFDVDGVVADTMGLFLDIVRTEFHVAGLRYADLTCYELERCTGLSGEIIGTVVQQLTDGKYRLPLKAFAGAASVLGRIAACRRPVLFVTARPYPGPLTAWFQECLKLPPAAVEIVAIGSFEAKAQALVEREISFFVEDRLETCFTLQAAGVTPVVFRQPWNRRPHPFLEVGSWREIAALLALQEEKMA